MKSRRHHNNKGYRQIKTGKPARDVARIRKTAIRLGIMKPKIDLPVENVPELMEE